jgi:siderophore synthetase component
MPAQKKEPKHLLRARQAEEAYLEQLRQCHGDFGWLEMEQFVAGLQRAREQAYHRLLYNLQIEQLINQAVLPGMRPHPAELIALIDNDGGMLEFSDQVCNHYLNDALARHYRDFWTARLSESRDSLLDYLIELSDSSEGFLFLEQWAALGHPLHPLAKAKIDLDLEDVVGYSPEFQARIDLPLLALHRSVAHVETGINVQDYPEWFAAHFPGPMNSWRSSIGSQQINPDNYFPVPVHPWQLRHRVGRLFQHEFSNKSIMATDSFLPGCAPLTSFRTLSSGNEKLQPDIKLPMDALLTSVRRTVSPRTCQMSPRISSMLKEVLSGDSGFSGAISLQTDDQAVHFLDDAGHGREKHLNSIYRQNISNFRKPGECLIPCFALLNDLSFGSLSLLEELIERQTGGLRAEHGRQFFKTYVYTLLPGLLRLYLVYGVAYEAHHQNVLLVVDESAAIRRFILRDLGGPRIHRPTIEKLGLGLKLHPDRLTVTETMEPLRIKFVSSVMFLHFGQLVAGIAGKTGGSRELLWYEVFRCTKSVLEELRPEVDGEVFRTEYRVLLQDQWCKKALVRINLGGSREDLSTPVPNPLVEFSGSE